MIIIFGGAFNPPTLAHYEIAEKLISKFNPNIFYFLPVGNRYNNKKMLDFNYRRDMVNIMANKLGAKVSEMENEESYRGTYYALLDFKKIDPDVYFVMGADNLDYLDKWINAEELIKTNKFIVLSREGFDVYKLVNEKYSEHKNNFHIVEIDNKLSSTLFRVGLDKNILLSEVYEYIKKNNLYGVDLND